MPTVSTDVNVKWIDSTFMVGADSRGRFITIGRQTSVDGEQFGLKPSDLLLLSAAACSTYDVVTILSKQREPFTGVEVKCTGEQNADPPNDFTAIHLHYLIKGAVNPDRVARAIKLSEDKYCSVIATLRNGVHITSDFEILDGE